MCPKSRSRFTLVEIMAVMAVIALLMGAVLGIVDYVSRKNGEARTLAVVEMLRSGLEQYKEKYGFYPPTIGRQTNGYVKFQLDKVDTGASAPDREKVANNFNQFIDYNHFTQSGKSKKEDGVYYILDGFGGYIYYRCPGYVNKTAYDLGSLGSDDKVGDGKTTAVTAAAAGDDFGKGDDITNCRR